MDFFYRKSVFLRRKEIFFYKKSSNSQETLLVQRCKCNTVRKLISFSYTLLERHFVNKMGSYYSPWRHKNASFRSRREVKNFALSKTLPLSCPKSFCLFWIFFLMGYCITSSATAPNLIYLTIIAWNKICLKFEINVFSMDFWCGML